MIYPNQNQALFQTCPADAPFQWIPNPEATNRLSSPVMCESAGAAGPAVTLQRGHP